MVVMSDDADELDEIDRDALRRAMATRMADKGRARQLTEMLTDRSWTEVAKFAAYSLQNENLKLKPWEEPPCHAPDRGPAGELCDQLLDANLSQWEPDPQKALAKARKRQATSRRGK